MANLKCAAAGGTNIVFDGVYAFIQEVVTIKVTTGISTRGGRSSSSFAIWRGGMGMR